MKRGTRIIALVLAIMFLLGAFASVFAKGQAWEKDVFAYGSALTKEQIDKTADILGIVNQDNVNKVLVNAEDLYKYLKIEGTDSEMISSIYIVKTKEGSGLTVKITDLDMITQVTGEEYTNAALTAGIKDAAIYVGAYRPVTGTSALTGVYKAYELNGEKLDEERIKVANEELETVNAIVREHKDEAGFDPARMTEVVASVKEALIDYKKQNNDQANETAIRDIINQNITKFELNGIITDNNINNLVVYFQNFQNSPAIDSKDLQEQLKNFQDSFSKQLGDLVKDADDKLKEGVDKAKELAQSEEAKNIFSNIMDFLKEVFNKIVDLFRG